MYTLLSFFSFNGFILWMFYCENSCFCLAKVLSTFVQEDCVICKVLRINTVSIHCDDFYLYIIQCMYVHTICITFFISNVLDGDLLIKEDKL